VYLPLRGQVQSWRSMLRRYKDGRAGVAMPVKFSQLFNGGIVPSWFAPDIQQARGKAKEKRL
jgi:hypothetical protein